MRSLPPTILTIRAKKLILEGEQVFFGVRRCSSEREEEGPA
jgi:hypothetical protein